MKRSGGFYGSLFGTMAVALLAMLSSAACSSSSTATPGSPADAGGDTAVGTDGGGRSSQVVTDGYLTAGPWMGYGFTATDPGAAVIVPDCSGAAGCAPPFTGSDFCMHGTVTGRPDYTGFAMLGWNVNQATGTGTTANTWAVPATGGVTVTVSNIPPSTALRVQLQGTDPHSGADRWCAALTSGVLMPWSSFTTNCYAGGTPQTPLTAGTPIQQGSILVPGLLTDLPFDVCLIDIQITP
jgi:hypothetical protein